MRQKPRCLYSYTCSIKIPLGEVVFKLRKSTNLVLENNLNCVQPQFNTAFRPEIVKALINSALQYYKKKKKKKSSFFEKEQSNPGYTEQQYTTIQGFKVGPVGIIISNGKCK